MGRDEPFETPKSTEGARSAVQPLIRVFTAGPWLVNELYDGGPIVVYVRLPEREKPVWRTSERYVPVPPVCRLESCGELATDRWANARLIAAAPDLLGGCEAAVDALERLGVTALTEMLRATIAKAMNQ